ncbi:MAG: caspase family protein, partial [Blastocatellia bacterium]
SQRYLNTLRVWDVSDPAKGARALQAITVAEQFPTIAFSADGRIAVLSNDVKLYDVASGRETMKLSGHTLPASSIAFSEDGRLIVTGSEDGSARLWNGQSGELMATLVHLNGGADWLVVTPDGLFDGTPGAWNQILWRFSQNIFDVTPVEVYFSDFFYPGLLAEIHAGNPPRAAKDVTQKDRRQPQVAVSLTEGQSGAARNVKVKLEVSEPAPGAGARDLRLFRNGTLVKVWRGDLLKGQPRAAFEAQLPIVAGENRITAYAFNRDNVKSSDASVVVAGAETLRRKGVAYVLAFGVNQYANAQYNLRYAVADATSFADEVRAQQMKLQQYERVEIVPLVDREATKANILLALQRLSNAATTLPAGAPAALAKLQPTQPEDAVVLYFAGHGTAQGKRFYLVPHDLGYAGARDQLSPMAVQMILAHSLSDLELESALETVDAGQLLFVLDACNSGQALEAEEKRRGPMNSSGLAQLAYEKGMYILTAAQSYQVALEAAQLGHGYLTFALVEEGLKKGMADRDLKDGQVVVREWFNYATERVPQMQQRNLSSRLLLEEEVKKTSAGRTVQRPRVFFRRETETQPLVVAKP